MRKHLFIKLTAIILVVVTLFSVSALTISAASNNKNNSVTQKEPVAKSKKNHNYTDNLKEINDKLDKLISKDNKVIKNLKDAKAAEKVAGDLTKTLITAFTDPDKLDKNFAIDACAEVINLAAACLGFGGIAEAITGPIAGLIKGDSPSEIELLQEHIDEQFEIVHEELEEVRNDISDLSKHMDESFAAVIKELEDAIEAQAAGEKVYAFTSSGVGNFDYTLFKNYVYGSSTEASDMSNQAYYDKLLLAIANDASDEVIEEY